MLTQNNLPQVKDSQLENNSQLASVTDYDLVHWQQVSTLKFATSSDVFHVPINPRHWPDHVNFETRRNAFFSSNPTYKITSSAGGIGAGRIGICQTTSTTELYGTGITHVVHQVRGTPTIFVPEWKYQEERLSVDIEDSKSNQLVIFQIEDSNFDTAPVSVTIWCQAGAIHNEFLVDPITFT